MSVKKAFYTIFIVEDEKTISRLIQLKLDEYYDDIQVYDNGLNALEAIKEQKPDLVILDVMLPGMQGFNILEEIKNSSTLYHIKVLMLTAKSREEDLERAFEHNADEFMSKPFKMNELLLRIKKLLS